MRKLAITIAAAAAVIGAGLFAWNAEATTGTAAATLGATAKNYSPVQKSRLLRLGTSLSPGFPLDLRSLPVLVPPLLS